jgi:predicted XRE-type DNA-binding protein
VKLSKSAKQLAQDFGLSDVDAYMMELKSNLFSKASDLIESSKRTHEETAKNIGTSRSRISRIANHGENNIFIELLIKLITELDGKPAIVIAAE